LLGRRRFFVVDDFSILEMKEECFMAFLSRLDAGKEDSERSAWMGWLKGRGAGRAALALARMEVRFLLAACYDDVLVNAKRTPNRRASPLRMRL
jgi:hypothetical protein